MYLGFAAGVGKTYQMLADAHELVKRGVDLVIGYIEPHGRKDTIAQAQGLELIPSLQNGIPGSGFRGNGYAGHPRTPSRGVRGG